MKAFFNKLPRIKIVYFNNFLIESTLNMKIFPDKEKLDFCPSIVFWFRIKYFMFYYINQFRKEELC
ncbi:hypothetical protein BKP45_12035 [Anaerobacillus alkalidiazotrophicus]|uniref:Uncharacterized protein n=1 Tax=Anaerobacillus alkalidiazotrophicus TaxID=472963 RepID=A0A1S2M1F2_9BACI|nr:hypothetical protein BKP45_17750 [Anaerobacillus alkalidiazotrophicus]OIJ19782.1 hypothetical protein BKP45_12035 [Anaerobacillus alkalidiazotrophicus]